MSCFPYVRVRGCAPRNHIMGVLFMAVLPCALNVSLLHNPARVIRLNHDMTAHHASTVPSVKISNGMRMPMVVLGMGGLLNAQLHMPGPVSEQAHQRAQAMAERWLNLGGRGLDTAQAYTDEAEAGNAWRNSNLSRNEIFILTKFSPPKENEYESGWTNNTVQNSLDALGVDYIDLMLIHSPGSDTKNAAVWKDMEDMVSSGKLKAIGVSNFDAAQLRTLSRTATIPIALNQRSLNVLQKDEANLQYCLQNGITYQAYTPLGGGEPLNHAVVKNIAQQHNKSAAQVALKWILQRGAVLSVQSEDKDHQKDNMDLFGWNLTAADMKQLDDL